VLTLWTALYPCLFGGQPACCLKSIVALRCVCWLAIAWTAVVGMVQLSGGGSSSSAGQMLWIGYVALGACAVLTTLIFRRSDSSAIEALLAEHQVAQWTERLVQCEAELHDSGGLLPFWCVSAVSGVTDRPEPVEDNRKEASRKKWRESLTGA